MVLFEAVALHVAPAFGVESLVFPDRGIDQIGTRQIKTVNDNAISMPTQRAVSSSESKRLGWRKPESSSDQMLARALLEIVPAVKDLARPGREHRFAPPIELNTPQALVSDDRCA